MALDPMLCAGCSKPLEHRRTTHGVVWVCPTCVAGATTLGVIRTVAPREFVNHVWQAARRASRVSARRCPSCTQPLADLRSAVAELTPSLDVCCRCFLVWMDRPALSALRLDRARSRSIHTRKALAATLTVAYGVAGALEEALGPR